MELGEREGGSNGERKEGRDSSSLPNVFNPIHPLSNGFCRCVVRKMTGLLAAVAVVAFMMTGGRASSHASRTPAKRVIFARNLCKHSYTQDFQSNEEVQSR